MPIKRALHGGATVSWNDLISAAKNGHTHIFQWIEECQEEWNSYARLCIKSKHELIRWKEWVCEVAATHGQRTLLVYAHMCGASLTVDHIIQAVQGGHAAVSRYLINNVVTNAQEKELIMLATAYGGHVPIMQYLVKRNFRLSHHIFILAARNGHVSMMQFLLHVRCPWSVTACAAAAGAGCLDALKWLRRNGCPWDTYTVYCAFVRSHYDVAQWAIQNGAPIPVAYKNKLLFVNR